MEGEKEEIKSIAEAINEELELPKAIFNKMVRVYHKQTYDSEVTKSDEFQLLYEAILK